MQNKEKRNVPVYVNWCENTDAKKWIVINSNLLNYFFYVAWEKWKEPFLTARMVVDSPVSYLADLMMELVDTYKIRLFQIFSYIDKFI
jgi:hypothetical protein